MLGKIPLIRECLLFDALAQPLPLKLSCLNGHALCTYFVGKYGRLFNSLSAKSVLAGEKLVATYSIST